MSNTVSVLPFCSSPKCPKCGRGLSCGSSPSPRAGRVYVAGTCHYDAALDVIVYACGGCGARWPTEPADTAGTTPPARSIELPAGDDESDLEDDDDEAEDEDDEATPLAPIAVASQRRRPSPHTRHRGRQS